MVIKELTLKDRVLKRVEKMDGETLQKLELRLDELTKPLPEEDWEH